jgi:hypothetical protein
VGAPRELAKESVVPKKDLRPKRDVVAPIKVNASLGSRSKKPMPDLLRIDLSSMADKTRCACLLDALIGEKILTSSNESLVPIHRS